MSSKMLVKSVTVNGNRYRIVKAGWEDRIDIEGPGLVGGLFLPGGIAVVSEPDFRERVAKAINEQMARNKAAREWLSDRLRNGTAGIG